MITIFLLLWLIPIGVNIYIDREGKKPNYFIVFTIRGFIAIVHAMITDIFCNIFPDNLHLYSAGHLFLIWLPILCFQVTSFWIFFELGLNIVRGRELLYYDRKERDSGWIDKIFDVLGNGAHLIAKIICLIILVLSIVSLYNHVS